MSTPSERLLQSERWAGAVDAVGGSTTDGLLKSMARGASIAISGNAGGVPLNTNVLPFILRGVNLLGIDSNLCPHERRVQAWERLGELVTAQMLDQISHEASLEDVLALSEKILKGKIRGRVLVKVG